MVKFAKTLREISDFVGGKIFGNPDELVFSPQSIEKAKEGEISFLVNPKYEKFIYETCATCLIVGSGFTERKKEEISSGKIKVKNFIEVENPYIAMVKVLSLWEYKSYFPEASHNLSFVSPSAKVGRNTIIFPFCYVGKQVEIGENCVLFPGVFIGDFSKIGDRVVIFPNSVLYPFSEIGDDSIIHAGAVIGADGFGYFSFFGEIIKIPQVGNVKIGKRVELGANTCVDRATMGSTEIGDDVKIDNLVQVAHNVKIGKGTRIAALTGIAGSSEIGEGCIFGGQVGVVDHVKVGDFSVIAARSAIISDIHGGKVIMGEPAMERTKFLKIHSLYLKLPEIFERLKSLEKEFQNLKDKINKE
jgi:UDP-3-O-[3-hydroxymyristoyl] glucosamine N-acyltransferase